MKISLNWLKEFVELDLTAEQLAEALTMTGLEVEGILPLAEGINGVIIAQIMAVKPHPAKEGLWLCQVSDGSRDYQVVCGAQNMTAGDKAILALTGARLAKGLRIKKGKFRGVLSEGMLCSEAELGLAEEAREIIILGREARLGEDPLSFYQLRDVILDITVTPNRPDCLSVLGVARELAAITGGKLNSPETKLSETLPRAQELVGVKVLDPSLCPRYSARIMTDVRLGPSPLKVKARLQAAGIRPINNLVDATNYVMLEMGQPLHAFDLDLLEGREIVVRRAGRELAFVTLDGQERQLTPEMLVICDRERPVAVAGVMGGHNTEVSAGTSNILLEAAHFDPVSIRRTSKRLKLSSEASIRFERGVDPEATVPALELACRMIQQAAGGKVLTGVVDCRALPAKQQKLKLRVSRARQVLGLDMSTSEVEKVFESLGLAPQAEGGDVEVTVPCYRFDLKEEIDLIEELARLIGYNRVPLARLRLHGLPGGGDVLERVFQRSRELLSSQGYLEAINYSFISPALAGPFLGNKDGLELVEVSNPLSQEQSVMRPSLIPGLIESARRNVNRDLIDLRFFELGKVFWLQPDQPAPKERWMVSALATGARAAKLWDPGNPKFDFHDLRGAMENLLEGLGIAEYRFQAGEVPYLNEERRAGFFVGDQLLGVLGEVHPEIVSGLGLEQPAYVFELCLEELVSL
ncbi:MAG: phenylalanine--tRNA ligase subunit beta, partial [Thermodesulfobacteriota bacterium]